MEETRCSYMSQAIKVNLAAPLHELVSSSGKVSSAPNCFVLQQVAQQQNTRWNLFTCHCQSASQVSQTDNHPESHVTTHLLLILNVCLEAPIWKKACLFVNPANIYSWVRKEETSVGKGRFSLMLVKWQNATAVHQKCNLVFRENVCVSICF